MLRHTEAGAVEYGLVNHQPSGDVYLMRLVDGAVIGPILVKRHHYEIFQNAANWNHEYHDAGWSHFQEWTLHNLDGTCEGCRE